MTVRSLFVKIFLWFWTANLIVAAAAVTAVLLLHRPTDPNTSTWRSVAAQSLRPQAQSAVELLGREGALALSEYFERQDFPSGTHSFLLDTDDEDLGGHRVPRDLLDVVQRARDSGAVEVASSGSKTLVALRVADRNNRTYVFAREMLPEDARRAWPPPDFSRGPGKRRESRERGAPPDWGDGPPSRPRGGGPGKPGHGPDADDDAPPPPVGRGADREKPARTNDARRPDFHRHGPGPRRGPPRAPPDSDPILRLLDEPALLATTLVAIALTGGLVCYAMARHLTRPVRTLRGATRRLAAGDLGARAGVKAQQRRDEIGQLARDFDFMAERMESLVTSHTQLLRDVSHELRSPLARLILALELATAEAGPAAAPALERVGREAQRLNDLIAQLLALARLEGGAPANRTPVDLAVLVAEIAADADFEAAPRGRRVRVLQCDPCTMLGSPNLLRSAIENVVRNAANYTDPGTDVEISLITRPIADDAVTALIEVRDHGPGVPEESLQDIFRPFYRVSDARDRKTGGVGLGLAITERAIRSHGGSVRAANAASGGLIVRIELAGSIGSAL